jgi:hypothetical protein
LELALEPLEQVFQELLEILLELVLPPELD